MQTQNLKNGIAQDFKMAQCLEYINEWFRGEGWMKDNNLTLERTDGAIYVDHGSLDSVWIRIVADSSKVRLYSSESTLRLGLLDMRDPSFFSKLKGIIIEFFHDAVSWTRTLFLNVYGPFSPSSDDLSV